ncbi:uncharacterized protein LOC141721033 [Apium graveolens]|uniref:uncharacterized protein LOC141721033 n=1 Tax=Apium graveolens TaxID=4045 RepID=UPI003D790F01
MLAEDVYAALTRKDWQKVIDLRNQHPEGPFLKLSHSRDSVLQKALYAGDVELVLALLDDAKKRFSSVREEFEDRLTHDVNIINNTILHVAATQDSCLEAAIKIYEFSGHLLFAQNNRREFPIFSATRYGQFNMFKFLNQKIMEVVPDEECRLQLFYKVSKEHETYTILHVAIYNEHFELALHIARTIPDLIGEEDHNGMTGLHMLAMNSSAFEIRHGKWLKFLLPCPFRHLSDEILGDDATGHKVDDGAVGSCCVMKFPYWNKIRKEHRRYQAARKLGSILVKKDTKWIDKLEPPAVAVAAVAVADSDAYTEDDNSALLASVENLKVADKESAKADADFADEGTASVNGENRKRTDRKSVKPPTPLILATKYGCLGIALEMIKEHPQTVEQVDREYGSILHLAIKYRRIEIFNEVEKMKMQMRKLVRLLDKDRNSILHMVALNTTKVKAKNGSDNTSSSTPKDKPLHPWDTEELISDSRSPAFVLQDDLLLFERVEDILKTHYHKVPNKDYETADQLFAAKKELLRDDAQEWIKRTAENCSLVAVLIATVAFAAAYTVPGGSNPDGSPVLLNQAFFVVFTVTDVLSLHPR